LHRQGRRPGNRALPVVKKKPLPLAESLLQASKERGESLLKPLEVRGGNPQRL
jgi:hypothetical protein